jgi:hypothetical protein
MHYGTSTSRQRHDHSRRPSGDTAGCAGFFLQPFQYGAVKDSDIARYVEFDDYSLISCE